MLSTVPQLLLALALAHLINTKLRGRTFFRMSVLLPQVTSLVAVALIFTQLFSRDYGLFNYLLGGIGISPVDWEAGRFSSWVALSVMVTWRWTGYNALLYLAAMQAIPDDLYESAAIDGARRWRQFWHITVPMIRPTIIFTVIISTIGGLQLFTEPFLFQPVKNGAMGGSARQYQTIAMYLYEKSFGSSQFKFGPFPAPAPVWWNGHRTLTGGRVICRAAQSWPPTSPRATRIRKRSRSTWFASRSTSSSRRGMRRSTRNCTRSSPARTSRTSFTACWQSSRPSSALEPARRRDSS